MRAGALDRRVIVQRRIKTQSPSGAVINTWAAIGSMRWALRFPISGDERFVGEQFAAREQVEFRLRWDDALASLQPTDRIIEPSDDASSSPIPTRSIYEIMAVHEIGRRVGLRVLTFRRSDVS